MQTVLDYCPALYLETDMLDRYVRERVTLQGDQISILPCVNGADSVLPSKQLGSSSRCGT